MVEYTKEQEEFIKRIITINPKFEEDFDWENFKKWQVLSTGLILHGKAVVLQIKLEELIESIANGQWQKEVVEKDIKTQEKEEMKKAIKLANKELASQVKITEIATKYGLKVEKNKAVCPFHGDSDPSLSFSDSKGVFNCFGCGERGNILTFIKKMEELKNGEYRTG